MPEGKIVYGLKIPVYCGLSTTYMYWTTAMGGNILSKYILNHEAILDAYICI